MFTHPELREEPRKIWSAPVQYTVVVPRFKMVEKITGKALSVDISRGGVGLLTDIQFEAGQLMVFEQESEINGASTKIAIIRWVDRSKDNKYRTGLQFV